VDRQSRVGNDQEKSPRTEREGSVINQRVGRALFVAAIHYGDDPRSARLECMNDTQDI
jgi:hypothetical protein